MIILIIMIMKIMVKKIAMIPREYLYQRASLGNESRILSQFKIISKSAVSVSWFNEKAELQYTCFHFQRRKRKEQICLI